MTHTLLLLDTNIVSFLMRADPLAEAYKKILGSTPRSISFMTIAELYEGAFRADWGSKRMMFLEEEINKYVVHPSTEEICQTWGKIRSARRQRPIGAQDAWIAATALIHSCPLVTHDVNDFHGITGLKILTLG